MSSHRNDDTFSPLRLSIVNLAVGKHVGMVGRATVGNDHFVDGYIVACGVGEAVERNLWIVCRLGT